MVRERCAVVVFRSVAVVGWLLVVADAAVPDEVWTLGRADGLVFLAAGVSSLALIARYLHRPIHDVFDAGREFERRQLLVAAVPSAPAPLSRFRVRRARRAARVSTGGLGRWNET